MMRLMANIQKEVLQFNTPRQTFTEQRAQQTYQENEEKGNGDTLHKVCTHVGNFMHEYSKNELDTVCHSRSIMSPDIVCYV